MKNPYAITQRGDGWWLVLNDNCGTDVIGRNAQTKTVACRHALEAFANLLDLELNRLKEAIGYEDVLIRDGWVSVISPDCMSGIGDDE